MLPNVFKAQRCDIISMNALWYLKDDGGQRGLEVSILVSLRLCFFLPVLLICFKRLPQPTCYVWLRTCTNKMWGPRFISIETFWYFSKVNIFDALSVSEKQGARPREGLWQHGIQSMSHSVHSSWAIPVKRAFGAYCKSLDIFAEQVINHILRQQGLKLVDVTLWAEFWVAHHLPTKTYTCINSSRDYIHSWCM